MTRILTAVLMLIAVTARAEDAALKIHGDLMIHPDQVADFFNIGATEIRNSPTWAWPALSFSLPYKTAWTNVVAHGPFNIQFDTSTLKNQEFGFTLNWTNPELTVGKFDIHDTVRGTTSGGIPYEVILDGMCSNMELKVPNGQWAIKGKARWDYAANNFVVTWVNFSFGMNSSAAPLVNLGQCNGPGGLIQALHDAVIKITSDQNWLQDVLRQGVQDWMQSTMGSLHAQLLVPREVKLKERIGLKWVPAQISTMLGGLIRVAGTFNLSKVNSRVGADQLPRNYDPATTLLSVTESGFVFPRDSMQRILRYMYSNGELRYRTNSSVIDAFVSLMNSRFLQFFIWPDLMQFDTNTNFVFDLGTSGVPALGTGGMMDGGGSSYPFKANLLVHQWAPNEKAYVPYVDFTAPVTGTLIAGFADGKLNLQMQTDDMNIESSFRSEYSAIRQVSSWISTWILGSSVKDYLNTTTMSVDVPNWQVGNQLSLGMRDVQVWNKTFRIPLQFKATGN